ncbi:MAG: hypothetical protein JWN83_1160 [Chitinophagaceae bacterium]|nr:hypothetical protein [Chitinophagaceae bacterium]
MKILLDESLPRKLKADFGSLYDVKTVKDMGWLGKKNGELLSLMVSHNFNFFVTVDKNLRYQQNLERLEIIIFLLLAVDNRRITLQNLVEKIKRKIKEGDLKTVNEIF